jgi:hypothetical protein
MTSINAERAGVHHDPWNFFAVENEWVPKKHRSFRQLHLLYLSSNY